MKISNQWLTSDEALSHSSYLAYFKQKLFEVNTSSFHSSFAGKNPVQLEYIFLSTSAANKQTFLIGCQKSAKTVCDFGSWLCRKNGTNYTASWFWKCWPWCTYEYVGNEIAVHSKKYTFTYRDVKGVYSDWKKAIKDTYRYYIGTLQRYYTFLLFRVVFAFLLM